METGYAVAALPGLQLQAAFSHEGQRMVLPDNSAQIPAWSRIDLAGKYIQNLNTAKVTWRFGLDNATDQRAWQESPYKFGHAYLFPMASRTWRLNAQIDL
jgi:iron complex outermembrane receptor protein